MGHYIRRAWIYYNKKNYVHINFFKTAINTNQNSSIYLLKKKNKKTNFNYDNNKTDSDYDNDNSSIIDKDFNITKSEKTTFRIKIPYEKYF